jgi:hypothetical protein
MKSRRFIRSPRRVHSGRHVIIDNTGGARAKLRELDDPSAFRISTETGTGSTAGGAIVSAVSAWVMFITTYSTNDRLWHIPDSRSDSLQRAMRCHMKTLDQIGRRSNTTIGDPLAGPSRLGSATPKHLILHTCIIVATSWRTDTVGGSSRRFRENKRQHLTVQCPSAGASRVEAEQRCS